MVLYNLSIISLAAVIFGICESIDGRRYNINSNANQNVLGGDIRTREEEYPPGTYAEKWEGDEMNNGDYPDTQIYETDFIPPDEELAPEYDIVKSPGGTYGGQICDGDMYDYSPGLIVSPENELDDNVNNEQENRRQSGGDSHRRRWIGSPPIVEQPDSADRFRNWGHLSPQGWKYAYEHFPSRNPRPMFGAFFKAGAMLRRDNSNNANANRNTNIIRGRSTHTRPRYNFKSGRQNPSYPNYERPSYRPSTPSTEMEPPLLEEPDYPDPWIIDSSETIEAVPYMPMRRPTGREVNAGYKTFGGENANINSNTNVNIVGRRMKPRKRRSVVHQSKKIFITPNVGKEATTKVSVTDSSTSGGH